MTAKLTTAGTTAIKGLIVWRSLSPPVGNMSSLVIILITSAIGWISPIALMPKMSARLAPILSCMRALCLRSTQVMSGLKTRARTAKRKIVTVTVAVSIYASSSP